MNPNTFHFLLVLAGTISTIGILHYVGVCLSLQAETRRKLLHLAAGIIALLMPWLFDRCWPVFLLCGLTLVGLAAVRWCPTVRARVGADLYDVKRRSIGELLFPVSIALLFWLSLDDRVAYVVPMLVVTTADGAAAIAAARYGLSPYQTFRGKKTWEGTFIFLSVAFLATVTSLLLLSDVGRAEVLLIAGLIGLIGCIIEATTWSGVDNLFIPLGTYFALKRFLTMSVTALVVELAVVVSMMLIAVVWSRRTRLSTQANLAAILVAFVLWSIGGPIWVAPALAAFLLHPLLTRLPSQMPDTVDVRSVFSVSSCSLFWMALSQLKLMSLEASLYASAVGLAAHLCMISVVRRREAIRNRIPWRSHAWWAIVATAAMMACYLVVTGFDRGQLLLMVAAVTLAAVTSMLFAQLSIHAVSGRRWVIQAIYALCASVAAILIQQLPAVTHISSPPLTFHRAGAGISRTFEQDFLRPVHQEGHSP